MNPASFWARLSQGITFLGRGAPEPAAPEWLVRAFVGANLLVIGLLVTLTIVSLVNSRDAHLDRTSASAMNTARTLSQSIGSEVDQIDLLLRSAILGLAREPAGGTGDPAVLQKVMQGSRALLPHVEALRATDAAGIVRHGDGPGQAQTLDVATRAYFQQARDQQGRLVVSEPVVSNASHHWVVVFTRRLDGADGSFAGVVYATVNVDRFRDVLAGVRLGPQDDVTLRSRSLRLVARHRQGGREDIGSDKASAELCGRVADGSEAGVYTAVSALDGIERHSAYVRVGPHPFIVVAGLSVDEAMAPWRDELRKTLGLAGITLIVITSSTWLLVRAWQRDIRHAARHLREADRHRAWLRTASDGIHVVDRRGRLLEHSDSFAAMLGYEPGQMLGMDVTQWESCDPEVAVRWCASTQGEQRFKTRHRRADGTLIDVEVSSTATVIDGEELVFCASRDITERRRLEAETRAALAHARHSEQRVLEIADNVPAGIAYVDRAERMQFVNAVLARWLGLQPSQLIGKQIRELLTPERYAQRKALYEAVWRGETVRIPEHIPSLRGNVRHTDTVLVPKRDDSGEVVGFYSLSQDLTERVRMERTVERQARNLAAMTSISDDLMVVLDEQGTIQLANRAFEEVWQLPPGGAVGRTLSALYGNSFFHDVIRPKLRHALDGQPVKVRTAHAPPGRPTRVFDASYHPVYDEHGLIDAVVFTAHDVDDLVHSRDELAHTVEELQRSNESLEQFVRVTSHDMREPLNSIAQFVRLIEESGTLAPPADQYFAFVRRGAARMRTMLDDLLRFVRLEAAAIDPDDTHQLDEVLREVQHLLHAQIAASRGELRCDPMPLVKGRRSLLVLLFQNLVSNALKFTPPGVPPRVQVSARRDGDRVHVTVADQGIGIAQADIPTLFEPFRRLHRRQVYEGTGLGLATCKRIAMVQGGTIAIASVPGQGTQVTVVLPAG
ncbi:MAG TPA: PAS domain-containing protein [Rhizobacter sp.]